MDSSSPPTRNRNSDSDSESNSSSNNICYCCVWKEGKIVYNYTIGDHSIDNMAALCLEMIPSYHITYTETIHPFTFAFLIDGAFVYFAILRSGTLGNGNSHVLGFLRRFRDEFAAAGGGGEERLMPAVRRLVASLEPATQWPAVSDGDGEAGSSTKAPLLARPSKHDRRKKTVKDDHGVVERDVETGEHRTTDDGQGTTVPVPASRVKSREKWCRQVRIVLAIDAAVCLLLFVIWLVICHGIECIH